jgi:catechol 2,3-dioxygenase-like lactoylglutathione lyase family enzyme
MLAGMAVHLNHTIVWARDKQATAQFLADVLGLGPPVSFGPFQIVRTANDVSLDVLETSGDIAGQHYAFLISEHEFDDIFGRIRERGLAYWADPDHHRSGEINTNDGGRGVYFEDPNGHSLEIITRPYSSGP